jgi:hypothetical protein
VKQTTQPCSGEKKKEIVGEEEKESPANAGRKHQKTLKGEKTLSSYNS